MGSIPACAGEPCYCDFLSSATRVYPRLRGGTVWKGAGLLARWGLSPLARGNLLL